MIDPELCPTCHEVMGACDHKLDRPEFDAIAAKIRATVASAALANTHYVARADAAAEVLWACLSICAQQRYAVDEAPASERTYVVLDRWTFNYFPDRFPWLQDTHATPDDVRRDRGRAYERASRFVSQQNVMNALACVEEVRASVEGVQV